MWLTTSPKNVEKNCHFENSSEVSKLTSANYPRNDTFSGMKKNSYPIICQQVKSVYITFILILENSEKHK